MLTTEIQQDTHTGPVTLNPRWLRIPSAVKYSGLSRSRFYELLAQERIKSICLKSHLGALRGVRLVDRESIIYAKPTRRLTTLCYRAMRSVCAQGLAREPISTLVLNSFLFAMPLAIMIMGQSRPWSDRYLFAAFNASQQISIRFNK
jgi:hypothetical protein